LEFTATIGSTGPARQGKVDRQHAARRKAVGKQAVGRQATEYLDIDELGKRRGGQEYTSPPPRHTSVIGLLFGNAQAAPSLSLRLIEYFFV
jgi:hypothetical protein